jgi:hypothetical protein
MAGAAPPRERTLEFEGGLICIKTASHFPIQN